MAITAEQLNIILTARDEKFKKAMDRNASRMERFAKKSNRGLKSTTAHFKVMGRAAKAAGAAIAAAISIQAVRSSARMGKEIANLSLLAGTNAEEFQRWAVAAETVGISQEKMADILKDVNDRVGDFLQTGGGPMKDFFENVAPLVGVTAEQFKNLSGPQALQLYVDTLQKAGASQQDFTFYLEAIASDATALVPLLKDNATELKNLGDEADRAGRILSNSTVAGAKELDDKLVAVTDQIRDKFTTALIGAEDELLLIAQFIMDDVVPAIEAMIKALGTGIEKWNEIKDLAAFITDRELPEGTFDDWMGTGAAPDGGGMTGLSPEDAARIYGGAPEDWEQFSTNTPLEIDVDPPEVDPPKPPGITPAKTPQQIAAEKAAAEAAAKALEQLTREYESLLGSLDPVVAAQVEFESNQKIVNDAVSKGVITAQQGAETMDLYAQSLVNASLEASDLATAMDGIQSSMESAFMGILDGTMSAKDAFRSMAKDIIRELYRVLVVQRLVGSFSAGGGGVLGSVFGAIAGRAHGGTTVAGQPYITGEHGRELHVPQVNGRVMTTSQTKEIIREGGSGGTNIYQTNHFESGVKKEDIAEMLPKIADTAADAVIDRQRRSVNGRGW